MAKQRLKRIQAGQLVRECLYTATFPHDSQKTRAEKAKFSSAARQALNDRYSYQKLKMMLAANFSYRDIFITLTYDDAHLPANVIVARKNLKKFFAALRTHRRARGQDLKYIYCTETLHDNGRIHHHLVINGTGDDYELIRSLWIWGTNLDFSQLETWGYDDLAKYMTKEPHKYGRNCVGERSWISSRNLAKPDVSPTEWVGADVRLEPPINAHVLYTNAFQNEWGTFHYIEYLLPRPPKQQHVRPKKRKFQTDVSYSDLEQCILGGKGEQKNAKSIARK